jgi:isopropylmalate/homocitrate/citramalate synthase
LASRTLPKSVTIVEVAPRDGLQNELRVVATAKKVAFIEALADAGVTVVEATSFVNPQAVPQLADAGDVMRTIRRKPGVRYPVLVPNERGLDRALEAGVDAIALFAAATEEFSQANIRCSIDESFSRFGPVANRARGEGLWMRGYVSVAFHCPYSGPVEPQAAVEVATRLFDLGCDEVSIADTIGTAEPEEVRRLLDIAVKTLSVDMLALHFHDTHGRAVDNIRAALDYGISTFDSSAGGLGGCPFAPGAPGNVATEQVLDLFADLGLSTGIDREAVIAAVTQLQDVRTV